MRRNGTEWVSVGCRTCNKKKRTIHRMLSGKNKKRTETQHDRGSTGTVSETLGPNAIRLAAELVAKWKGLLTEYDLRDCGNGKTMHRACQGLHGSFPAVHKIRKT